jgi:outer membrane beta-barrel protein
MKQTVKLALAALVVLAAARPALAADANADKTPEPAAAPPAEGGDPCIDEDVKADLFAKRRQRTSRDRLFQQTNRHELSIQGGYYVSDVFDGTYVYGMSYGYHMTEDLAVEAMAARSQLVTSGGPELERTFAVLQGKTQEAWLFNADLVWAPAHAKIRLGGSITHFDLYLMAGAGVIDSAISRDIAGNGGMGLKFFMGHAWAFRVDVRDYVFRQQLLSQALLVNDITVTAGFSIYLPMRE